MMSGHVLVIEDHPDNRKLVVWHLEDAGYTCEATETAEAGLSRLHEASFDLVLMDISLPGMDGMEATRQIRAHPEFAHLPVVAVTAHAIRGEAERILAAGVSALVTKPIQKAVLLDTIQALLLGGGSHDNYSRGG